MSNDLMQAYHTQLLNDEELARFNMHKRITSSLSLMTSCMIPFAVAFTLRPGAFNLTQQRVKMMWGGFGLSCVGLAFFGNNQRLFLN